MKTKFYRQLLTFIAITTVFVVVLPMSVSAADSSFITNIVSSSNNTGGKSSVGADGADGQAGKDGQSINSNNSAETVIIKSTINGVDVLDINNSKVFTHNVDTATTTHYISSSTLEIDTELLNLSSNSVVTDEQSLIYRTLLSLRLTLINYVNKLF